MERTIVEFFNMAVALNAEITQLIKDSRYNEFDDLSMFTVDEEDPDQLQLVYELRGVMEQLSEVQCTIEYLNRPIRYTSVLHKNENGRYETEQGDEFTCGRRIEALIPSREEDGHDYWAISSVEANNEGYYIVNHPHVKLDGLCVRFR